MNRGAPVGLGDDQQLAAAQEILHIGRQCREVPHPLEHRVLWIAQNAERHSDSLGRAVHALYGDRLAANLLYGPGCWTTARQIHEEIGAAILAGDGPRAQQLMAEHMQDFLALQEERTPWLLDERIAWAP